MNNVASEFAKVVKCDVCARSRYPKLLRNDSFDLPQPGYIGTNYRNTGVLFVAQNPGISHDYSNARDMELANALIAVTEDEDAQAAANVKNILDRIMPAWKVFNDYFPLADCGLRLDDIAYTNIVRCRTVNNSTPGVQIARTCIASHFIGWVDWLKPRVVVCIGKWAHDKVGHELEARGIPNAFINRNRSLTNFERHRNRREVAELVRDVLSNNQA